MDSEGLFLLSEFGVALVVFVVFTLVWFVLLLVDAVSMLLLLVVVVVCGVSVLLLLFRQPIFGTILQHWCHLWYIHQ